MQLRQRAEGYDRFWFFNDSAVASPSNNENFPLVRAKHFRQSKSATDMMDFFITDMMRALIDFSRIADLALTVRIKPGDATHFSWFPRSGL